MCMYEDDSRKRMTEAYIAEHLWLVVGALYAFSGNKLDTPRYTEMIEPKLAEKDKRTARQIISDIRDRL